MAKPPGLCEKSGMTKLGGGGFFAYGTADGHVQWKLRRCQNFIGGAPG
jgi:hypothetical protein